MLGNVITDQFLSVRLPVGSAIAVALMVVMAVALIVFDWHTASGALIEAPPPQFTGLISLAVIVCLWRHSDVAVNSVNKDTLRGQLEGLYDPLVQPGLPQPRRARRGQEMTIACLDRDLWCWRCAAVVAAGRSPLAAPVDGLTTAIMLPEVVSRWRCSSCSVSSAGPTVVIGRDWNRPRDADHPARVATLDPALRGRRS